MATNNLIVRERMTSDQLRERIAALKAAQKSTSKRRGRGTASWHRLFTDMVVGEGLTVEANAKNQAGDGTDIRLPKFASVRNWLRGRAKEDGVVFEVFGQADDNGNGTMVVIRAEDDPSLIVEDEAEDTEEAE